MAAPAVTTATPVAAVASGGDVRQVEMGEAMEDDQPEEKKKECE